MIMATRKKKFREQTMIGNPEPQCLRSLSLGILLHAAGLHVQGGVLGGGPLEPGDLVVDGNEAGKGDTEGVVDPRGDGVQGPSQSVDGPGVVVVAVDGLEGVHADSPVQEGPSEMFRG